MIRIDSFAPKQCLSCLATWNLETLSRKYLTMSTSITGTSQDENSPPAIQTGPPQSPARRGRGSRGGGRGRGRAPTTANERPEGEDDRAAATGIPAEDPIVKFEVFEKGTVRARDRNSHTTTIQAPNVEALQTFLEAQLLSRVWVKGYASMENAAWTLIDCSPATEENPHFND